jgi:hypothetical protein
MNPHPDSPAPAWLAAALLFAALLTALGMCDTLFEGGRPVVYLLLLGAPALPLIFAWLARRRRRSAREKARALARYRATFALRWLALQAEAARILANAREISRPTGISSCDRLGRRFHRAWIEGYHQTQRLEGGFFAERQATPLVTGYWPTEPREGWLSGDD